jgi:hypothetical protein
MRARKKSPLEEFSGQGGSDDEARPGFDGAGETRTRQRRLRGAGEQSGDTACGVDPFSQLFERDLLRGQGVVLRRGIQANLGVLLGAP